MVARPKKDRYIAGRDQLVEGTARKPFVLSVVTIFELEKSVLLLQQKTPFGGANLRKWLEEIKLNFVDRALPYALETAAICAVLHVPDPKPERDAMIAATALEHKFAAVTHNVADFANTSINLVNLWQI